MLRRLPVVAFLLMLLPSLAQAATIVYQDSGPHVVLVLGNPAGSEILDDVHTIGTGLLTGFDIRYSNRGAAIANLSISFYQNSPGDDLPGALIAGPYVLSGLTTDGVGVTHEAHIDVPDPPVIPTYNLWIGYTSNSDRCGLSWTNADPNVGTTHPIAMFRPPLDTITVTQRVFLTLYMNTSVGVASSPTAGLDLAVPRPNPVVDDCRFVFTLPAAGPVRLALYDASGRRVRTLIDGPRPAGSTGVAWDARDSHGVRLRPGAYWARLETAADTRTRRFVVL